MLSAGGRPASRPRPPSQRKHSHTERQRQHTPHSEATSPSARIPLTNIKNVVQDTSSDTVYAAYNSPVSPSLSKTRDHNPSSTQSSASIDRAPTSAHAPEPESPASSHSEQDLDHALLGALDRYELEELLIEASRKMRERERKLVIAANIGKALLEKNLTLRSGIMDTMASSSSLCALNDIEAMIDDYSETKHATDTHDVDDCGAIRSPLRPMNSPPTTDIDACSQGDISPGRADSDITPIAHPIALPDAQPDYFSRPTAPTLEPTSSVWVPSDAGLIASSPCSPSASISSFASHALLSPHSNASRVTSKKSPAASRHRSRPSLLQLQALEAQRQLLSLGEQNDVLHQQISELQHEAEEARNDGGKKFSRLNKEIRGLKAELEAATRRNNELEASGMSTRPGSAPRSPLRDLAVARSSNAASPLILRVRERQEASTSPLAINPSPDEAGSHHLLPSTSNLEEMVRSAQTSEGESALLAQLLAKIKELEETNAAMAEAEEDFGSRMGRAMQEEERLRDALNTVGQDLTADALASRSGEGAGSVRGQNASPLKAGLHQGFITPSHSLRSLDSFASPDVPSIASPSQRRRAPGNRHVIEHRKTVRTAIRRAKQELAADFWGPNSDEVPASAQYMSRSSTEQSLGIYSIDLSASSSAASSPRRKSLNRKVSSTSLALGPGGRPRIRITPSMEDLGQRRKVQEEVIAGPPQASPSSGEWQDVASPTASTFQMQATLRPSDAVHAYSSRMSTSPARGRPSQESPASIKSDTFPIRSLRIDNMPSLSPSQKRSFQPTARVRRSRSRASSIGSEAFFGSQASPVAHSVDPFLGESVARNRQRPHLSPASSYRGRTLGSELGSIFGGDDRKHDFDDDLPQRRRTTSSVLGETDSANMQALVLVSPAKSTALQVDYKTEADVVSDRPTAYVGRLVPESAEEHADDLECVLTQPIHANIDELLLEDSPLHPRDAALFARVEAAEQGAWTTDEPIIEAGGLQDADEPRGAQFDLISAVVGQEAVAWADDDDYGRMITQREAVKLGLLAPIASPTATRRARLLKNRSQLGTSIFGTTRLKKQNEKEAKPIKFEIESAEQVEHRLRMEGLLRRRRQEILKERGFDEGWEDLGPKEQEQEDRLVAAYAPTPQRLQERRHRGLSKSWLASPTGASPSGSNSRQSTRQWVRDLASISPTATRVGEDADEDHDLMSLDFVRPEDGEFELLDCPSWKKQGGRGTDYFPTSFRARYRPTMVKQRVAHVSQVTYGWVEEWVQFAFVVFLAFIVMVEQGPNRNLRRNKAPAPAALMPKGD